MNPTRGACSKSLKTAAGNDRYTELEEEIAKLESQLRDDKLTNLATYRGEITDAINSDVVLRHSYVEGVVEHGLTDDREVAEAVRLLDDPAQLARMLSPEVAQPDTEQDAAKDTVQAEEE